MSKYGDYIKARKEQDLTFFFGEVKHTSNKYFTFHRVQDNDNIVILTNNIKFIKGNPVLVIDNNKVVYLKDWQIRNVHNFYDDVEAYAVKLNRNYFKPYTFSFSFDDMAFEKEQTFDDLMDVAREQDAKNLKIACGTMG